MNWIDITLLLLLVISFFRGLYSGFVKEVASLIALILGIWGTLNFSSITSQKLFEWFDISGSVLVVVSFVLTFVLIVIAVHFIGNLVNRLVSAISLGMLNRLLGGLFGICKTTLFLSVILFLLNVVNERNILFPKDTVADSKLYAPISNIVPSLFPVVVNTLFDMSTIEFEKEEPQQETPQKQIPQYRQFNT